MILINARNQKKSGRHKSQKDTNKDNVKIVSQYDYLYRGKEATVISEYVIYISMN